MGAIRPKQLYMAASIQADYFIMVDLLVKARYQYELSA